MKWIGASAEPSPTYTVAGSMLITLSRVSLVVLATAGTRAGFVPRIFPTLTMGSALNGLRLPFLALELLWNE